MKFCGATDIGLCRADNQDCYAAGTADDGSVWIVLCDGMGGLEHGALASTRTVGIVEKRLRSGLDAASDDESVKKLLLKALSDGNREVLKTGISLNAAGTMGTTIVAAVIRGRTAYIAHAGDSRAYRIRSFSIEQLTRDHSVVQELVDRGHITSAQARIHPQKNIITSALGIEESPNIDYNILPLKKNDILLVCSDGLTNMVPDRTIKRIVMRTAFEKIADALVAQALKAGGADNVTVVLAKTE